MRNSTPPDKLKSKPRRLKTPVKPLASNRLAARKSTVLQIILLLGILFVVFWLFNILRYGGLTQARLELQSFPGIDSKEISEPRDAFNHHINTVLKRLPEIPGSQIMPVFKEDRCIKDAHGYGALGDAKGSMHAYSCTAQVEVVIGYPEDACQVVRRFVEAKLKVFTDRNCTPVAPGLTYNARRNYSSYEGEGENFFDVIVVAVENLKPSDLLLVQDETCPKHETRIVYCDIKNIRPNSNTALPVFNSNIKSVLVMRDLDPYYAK